MKCPNCNAEIAEDKLYCEACGYEINIVPVFEPEVYENLNKTLQGIVDDIDTDNNNKHGTGIYGKHETDDFDGTGDRPSFLRFLWNSIAANKIVTIVMCVIFCALICLLALLSFTTKSKDTYEIKLTEAKNHANQGDYGQAITSIEEAIHLNNDAYDAKLLRGDYYMALGKESDAINIYTELLNDPSVSDLAARKIIDYYLQNKSYTKLNKFLLLLDNTKLSEEYNQYIAQKPIFSESEGTYEITLTIYLKANTEGVIYYTLDGTTPSKDSFLYNQDEGIVLTIGTTKISAIFINSYEQTSEIANQEYCVTASNTGTPVINITDGVYTEPEYISVTVSEGCTAYYTTDGSIPTMQTAIKYSKVIPMKMGDTVYTFIAYNANGEPSSIVTVTTSLSFDYVVSVGDSVASLMNRLVSLGKLTDIEGHLDGKPGHYEYDCSCSFQSGNMIFYLAEEKYIDTNGTVYITGNKYAIDSGSGYLYSVSTDSYGIMTVTNLR